MYSGLRILFRISAPLSSGSINLIPSGVSLALITNFSFLGVVEDDALSVGVTHMGI